jgi:hypothetical protein
LRVVGPTLEGADEQASEDFAGLVAVADVFKGLGGVLAADVEEDFFAAAVVKGEMLVSWVLRWEGVGEGIVEDGCEKEQL